MIKKIPPVDVIGQIIESITQAQDLDALHLSIGRLLNTLQEGEFELFLEQTTKTPVQKQRYLEHVLEEVTSTPLRSVLAERVAEHDFPFFAEESFTSFLSSLRRHAETADVVRLQVAVAFKPQDIQKICTVLGEQLGKRVVLDLTVDHGLIGGAIVQVGDHIWDTSVRSRLHTFRSTWSQAVAQTS
jgi:ATP synthase F1 delta subunit